MARIVVRDIGMPSQVVQIPAIERPVIRVGAVLTDSVGPAGKDGVPGRPGADGQPGRDGVDGKSAYQVAVDNGFKGSVVEWLESLKGKDATIGADILDKYVKKSGDEMDGTLSIKNGFLRIGHNDNPDENHLLINSYGGNMMSVESWGGDLVLNSGFQKVVIGMPGVRTDEDAPKLQVVGNQIIGSSNYAAGRSAPENGLLVEGEIKTNSHVYIDAEPYDDYHAATVDYANRKASEEARNASELVKGELQSYVDEKIEEIPGNLSTDFVTTSSSQVIRGGKTFSDGITITDRSEQQTIRLSNNPKTGDSPDTLELSNKDSQDVIIRGVREPSEANDAANKAYVDSKAGGSIDTSRFLEKTGGTVTGKLGVATGSAPAGNKGDLNLGAGGFYVYRNANRYLRLNNTGTVADLDSFGADLAIGYDSGSNVTIGKGYNHPAKLSVIGNQTIGTRAFANTAPKHTNGLRVQGTIEAINGVEVPTGSSIKFNRAQMIAGTGFPEGVVSAPVGSVYIDENATSGAICWIKKTGTGNTGWVVMHGDTGWIKISSWGSDGVVSGATLPANAGVKTSSRGGIWIRRENYNIHWRFAGMRFVGSAAFPIPAGFNCDPYFVQVPVVLGSRVSRASIGTAAIYMGESGAEIDSDYAAYVTYKGTSNWPTNLPRNV